MAKFYLAQPFYETVPGACPHFWYRGCAPDGPNQLVMAPQGTSDLVGNFNALWTDCLNRRRAGEGFTHYAMVHADVAPYFARRSPDGEESPYWLDVMKDVMDKAGADVLSVVLRIKNREGHTSTAVDDPKTGHVRRLTMKEICKPGFPWTFDAAAAGFPGHRLLISSGLWVCRLDRPWIDKVYFAIPSRIMRAPDGNVRGQTVSDDWHFSRQLHRLGVPIVSSRCVTTGHWGMTEFRNDTAEGTTLEHDPGTDELGSQSWSEEQNPQLTPSPVAYSLPAAPAPRTPSAAAVATKANQGRRSMTSVLSPVHLHEQLAKQRAQTHKVVADMETLRAEYVSLLALLARVKAGEVNVQHVDVNLAEMSWRQTSPAEETPEPAAEAAPAPV